MPEISAPAACRNASIERAGFGEAGWPSVKADGTAPTEKPAPRRWLYLVRTDAGQPPGRNLWDACNEPFSGRRPAAKGTDCTAFVRMARGNRASFLQEVAGLAEADGEKA